MKRMSQMFSVLCSTLSYLNVRFVIKHAYLKLIVGGLKLSSILNIRKPCLIPCQQPWCMWAMVCSPELGCNPTQSMTRTKAQLKLQFGLYWNLVGFNVFPGVSDPQWCGNLVVTKKAMMTKQAEDFFLVEEWQFHLIARIYYMDLRGSKRCLNPQVEAFTNLFNHLTTRAQRLLIVYSTNQRAVFFLPTLLLKEFGLRIIHVFLSRAGMSSLPLPGPKVFQFPQKSKPIPHQD